MKRKTREWGEGEHTRFISPTKEPESADRVGPVGGLLPAIRVCQTTSVDEDARSTGGRGTCDPHVDEVSCRKGEDG